MGKNDSVRHIMSINTLSNESPSHAVDLTVLDSQQRTVFQQILYEFKHIFSHKPRCAIGYEHRIRLKKDKSVVKKNYPIPFAVRNATNEAIREMLDMGIIERSVSSYNNPLRVVQKKNGKVKVCLDARYLNAIIVIGK